MSYDNCQKTLRKAGKAYPRTCAVCGLTGPCRYYINLDIPKTAAERIAANREQPPENALLLTVARVLRAKIKNEIYAEQAGDLEALNDALAPFDPLPGLAINEAGRI